MKGRCFSPRARRTWREAGSNEKLCRVRWTVMDKALGLRSARADSSPCGRLQHVRLAESAAAVGLGFAVGIGVDDDVRRRKLQQDSALGLHHHVVSLDKVQGRVEF